MKHHRLAILAWLALSSCGGAETVRHTTERVPPPEFAAADSAQGEDLLFLQVTEREEPFDDRSVTTFYTFNPSAPKKGLEKVFRGPGEDQYCRMVTPLFNGWGIAHGEMDSEQEPEERQMFWYNLLSGKRGATVDDGMWNERVFGEYLAYFSDKLCRYNLRTGELVKVDVELEKAEFIGRSEVLTRTKLDDGVHIVRVDLDTLELSRIAQVPKKLQRAESVALAGEDGVYVVTGMMDGFSLWYCPHGKAWRPVVEKVHICKTFGGRLPHLPVKYLGKGRFAVAKTVKDSVDTEPENIFPDALSVTMLIDSESGEVIDQSDQVVYDHNPPLSIKDEWTRAAKESGASPAAPGDKRLFRWIEAEKAVEFGGGKKIVTGGDDEFSLSRSRRYLAVYREWSSEWAEDAQYLKFIILDGKTGNVHEKTLETGAKTIFVSRLSWLRLAGESVDKEVMDESERSALDPFRDPGAF